MIFHFQSFFKFTNIFLIREPFQICVLSIFCELFQGHDFFSKVNGQRTRSKVHGQSQLQQFKNLWPNVLAWAAVHIVRASARIA